MSTDSAIIRPPRRRQDNPIAASAILAATQPDVTLLRRRLDLPAAGESLFLSCYYPEASPFSRWGLAGPFMGAPQVAMLMETLAAWGARRFIFMGWCGALTPSVVSGDIVVPCGAFADEGTSRAYGYPEQAVRQPSPGLQAEFNAHLRRCGLDGHEGWVWTTDAVFRETEDKVRHFREQGALAVEMETSTLFTVARHLDVDLGAVLVVSDELSTFKWRPGFKTDRFKIARAAVCEAIASYVERTQL